MTTKTFRKIGQNQNISSSFSLAQKHNIYYVKNNALLIVSILYNYLFICNFRKS